VWALNHASGLFFWPHRFLVLDYFPNVAYTIPLLHFDWKHHLLQTMSILASTFSSLLVLVLRFAFCAFDFSLLNFCVQNSSILRQVNGAAHFYQSQI
jgi:hypothetical protein